MTKGFNKARSNSYTIVDQIVITIKRDENGIYSTYTEGGNQLPVGVLDEISIGVVKAKDKLNGW